MSRIRLLLRRAVPRHPSKPLPPPHHHNHSNPASTSTPSKLKLLSLRRSPWSYLWYASILALGLATGMGARHFAGPLGLPEPGSRDDERILRALGRDVEKLDIVTVMRGRMGGLEEEEGGERGGSGGNGGSRSRSTGGEEGDGEGLPLQKGWVEVDLNFGGDGESETNQATLTTIPTTTTTTAKQKGMLNVLAGTRGLGVQRAFWNPTTREMVAVIWLGGGLSGWPGVVHGGAIATIFEEVMTRVASYGPEGGRVVASAPRPASLRITYAKPTYSLDFYILRTSFSTPTPPPPSSPLPSTIDNVTTTQPTPSSQHKPQQSKGWLSWMSPWKEADEKKTMMSSDVGGEEIIGTLESVKGELCVRVKARFASGR